MTEINKANLISNLNTIISSLNLSTASENRLSLIYKAAVNDGETPTSIITELESRIEAVSTLSSIEKSLLYSLVTSLLTEDRSIVIADLTALNALTNISVGSVYYVESEGFPYIKKTDGSWTRIDPANQSNLLPNAWSWGNNTNGRLGDNTTVGKSSPVSVVSSFTDWVQVNSGSYHSLGLRVNGTAWAWGRNMFAELGDGTYDGRSSPVSVIGGFTDWVQLSGGVVHSLGLRANGTAWAWGFNNYGRLGDGTTYVTTSPVSVIGGFTDWMQLSAGGAHSLGLRANGTAWAWGTGSAGRLGDNTTTDKSSPVSVIGGGQPWVQLSAGQTHSLGLRANGTAWAWGNNVTGCLGDNSYTARSSPVSVVGGFTDWMQLSGGGYHSLGIRANGTAWSWGINTNGQLGNNTNSASNSPVSVIGGFTDWVQISAGRYHSVAVRASGSMWSWGSNGNSQLGDNSSISESKSSPVLVVGGFTDWIQVSAGNHTLGLRGSNSVLG